MRRTRCAQDATEHCHAYVDYAVLPRYYALRLRDDVAACSRRRDLIRAGKIMSRCLNSDDAAI